MFGTKSHNWWFVKLGHFPCGSIDTVALWPPMIISCGFCRGGLRCQRHVTSQHHLWSTVIWCQLLKGKTSNGFAERVGLSFVFQFWICRCFCSLPCFLMRKLLGRQFHGKRKKVIGKTQVAKQGGASSSDVIYLAGKAAKALAWPTRYNWQQKVLQHGVWLLSQLCHRTSNCVCSHQFKIHLSCSPIRTCPYVTAFSVWRDTSYMIVKMMWAYCWCWSDSYQKMFPLPSSGTWLLSEESSGFYSTWRRRRRRSPLASIPGSSSFLLCDSPGFHPTVRRRDAALYNLYSALNTRLTSPSKAHYCFALGPLRLLSQRNDSQKENVCTICHFTVSWFYVALLKLCFHFWNERQGTIFYKAASASLLVILWWGTKS